MSAEITESLGGLLMVGLPGPRLDDSTRRLIAEQRVNDFILFSRNVVDPPQLTELCAELAACCRQAGLPPPLIAIDQEGGTVARLKEPFSRFPDARQLAEGPEPEAALAAYAQTCARELLAVGINVNLAPVLDLCPAGQGYYMERRVLGSDPATVARLGRLVIATMQENGLAACGKHFPGLGTSRLDPHQVLPTLERSRRELEECDLPPFRAAAAIPVAAIMTSHTVYPAVDPRWPATLSPAWLTDILRAKLNYQGVIVTDDLEMGAIERRLPVAEAALLALQAGADQLLICHDHDKIRQTLAHLVRALANGAITPTPIAAALTRIATMRRRYANRVAGQ